MDFIGVKVTPRDQPVLNLLVQGSSNQEIAGQVSFSPRTCERFFCMPESGGGRKHVKRRNRGFREPGSDSMDAARSTNCEGNPDR